MVFGLIFGPDAYDRGEEEGGVFRKDGVRGMAEVVASFTVGLEYVFGPDATRGDEEGGSVGNGRSKVGGGEQRRFNLAGGGIGR